MNNALTSGTYQVGCFSVYRVLSNVLSDLAFILVERPFIFQVRNQVYEVPG